MKKIDRIRAREAARVCLIQAAALVEICRQKLAETNPESAFFADDFRVVLERQQAILRNIVADQGDEK